MCLQTTNYNCTIRHETLDTKLPRDVWSHVEPALVLDLQEPPPPNKNKPTLSLMLHRGESLVG